MEVHRYRDGAMLLLLTIWVLLPVSRTIAMDPIDFQVIHPQFGPSTAGPSYLAIRTRAEFDAALKWFPSSTPPLAASPRAIDFDHYTLLMADAGSKPSGGYSIVFSSVHEVHQGAVPTVAVYLLDLGPGSCPRTEELTHSIAFALIPKTSESIRFIVAKADSDCSGRRP
jgi:hypothetical protein